ncbi:MAG: hypothetical protein K0U74_09125 [Alphaproteobacteria bacterium]|nr:hypothetical protein [Alphaproteobacteria bacterium]
MTVRTTLNMSTTAALLAAVVLAPAIFAPAPSLAADAANPDWPCVQRKVEKLTSAQIWDGPPVDDVKGWWNDKEVNKLVRYAISRRVPMDEVEAAITKFAETMPEGPERDKRLTLLFAGVLDQTNTVRSSVVNGIEKFQRRQVARAKKLERDSSKLAQLRHGKSLEDAVPENVQKLQKQYDWDARVFKERQDNIPLACEIPVEIEQRAFAVGRAIRFHMS